MSTLTKITTVESKLFLRDTTSAIMTFALPIGLMVVFGSIGLGEDDPEVGITEAFLPVMALALSAALLGLSVLPTVLATYREKGILRRMSVTPVHPGNVLAAQLLVNLAALLAAAVMVVLLGALAFDLGTPSNVGGFLVAFVLTATALFAVGLLVAALAPTGKAATSIGMLLFFPSMFFAGVWTPGDLMPSWARPVRDVSPLGAGMEALQDAWNGAWPDGTNLIALAVMTVVAGGIAARVFRWE
ncbi:ABC transporter permease [Jiangella alkaliphila]|uniref:Transport permease protein n=1 Tax=Jiangella alkaliphila TaxID=419479 RepID=A0A1H2L1W4_9ACTN|nr:ABC transporter permease [Jiangella alkaliphila]SDU74919.1 ABC-2 type transport system permease protein [Jiangella alkaliphila]